MDTSLLYSFYKRIYSQMHLILFCNVSKKCCDKFFKELGLGMTLYVGLIGI